MISASVEDKKFIAAASVSAPNSGSKASEFKIANIAAQALDFIKPVIHPVHFTTFVFALLSRGLAARLTDWERFMRITYPEVFVFADCLQILC